eukprot:Tamp_09895.p1 GENE.Tamp_09895~~Tamp_09895.p1  ORF type:complete len:632 (+),score=69.99 Tamp_09895:203-1897(+)
MVTEDGRVLTLGVGTDGRLGSGTDAPSVEARCAAGLDAERAVMVACGHFHTAAVTASGKLYLWGFGGCGQLAVGDWTSRLRPTPVPARSLGGERVEYVACGLMQTAAVTSQGNLYAWGGGEYGQLGLGDDKDRPHPCIVHFPSVLDPECRRPGSRIISACCGSYFTAAVTADGHLYTWGLGDDGQLGCENCTVRYLPGLVSGLPHPVCVAAAGDAHMACASRHGTLYTWGAGKEGQLGLGMATTSSRVPRIVGGIESEVIVSVSCGSDHTAAVAADGAVYTFGMARGGRLGLPETRVLMHGVEVWTNRFQPSRVTHCAAPDPSARPAMHSEDACHHEHDEDACHHEHHGAGQQERRDVPAYGDVDEESADASAPGGQRTGRHRPAALSLSSPRHSAAAWFHATGGNFLAALTSRPRARVYQAAEAEEAGAVEEAVEEWEDDEGAERANAHATATVRTGVGREGTTERDLTPSPTLAPRPRTAVDWRARACRPGWRRGGQRRHGRYGRGNRVEKRRRRGVGKPPWPCVTLGQRERARERESCLRQSRQIPAAGAGAVLGTGHGSA